MINILIWLYIACGLIFYIVFIKRFSVKINAPLHSSKTRVKLFLAPAGIILWPILLIRILSTKK